MKIFVSTQVTLAQARFCLCRRQLAHTCSQQIVLADLNALTLPSVLDKVLHRSLAPPVLTHREREKEMFTCCFSFTLILKGVMKKHRIDTHNGSWSSFHVHSCSPYSRQYTPGTSRPPSAPDRLQGPTGRSNTQALIQVLNIIHYSAGGLPLIVCHNHA
ncbi:hypothetical protein QQF64_029278 [Cirrhinus molitorella]|uniref:Uncharacterized protein n=1 Tax=Cirrhinus molitorella TaxID=172907 RepID=A0ABR3N8X9_9TELE